MKKILLPVALLLTFFQSVYSQNLELTLSPYDGSSFGEVILNTSEDEWLVGGYFSFPGAFSWNSPFLYKVNSENEILWKFEGFEVGFDHLITELTKTANGDIIVAVDNIFACDLLEFSHIYMIDKDGNLIWKNFGPDLYVYDIQTTGDGRAFYNRSPIFEFNLTTGDIIGSLNQLGSFRAFLALENAEFILVKADSLLTKTDINGNILKEFTFPTEHDYYRLERIGTDEFTVFSDNQLYFFDNELNLIRSYNLSSYASVLKVITDGNDNWIFRSDDENDRYLIHLDSTFNFLDEVKIYERSGQNRPEAVAADEDEIVVVGRTSQAFYEEINHWGDTVARPYGQDTFVKSYSKENLSTQDYQTDIEINNLELDWDFAFDTIFNWCNELSATLLVANISFTLTNHGTENLDSISVKTDFVGCHDFCNLDQHFRKDYTDLNLLPGESLELVFNNFFVKEQPLTGPLEICFWISLPNSKLDNHFENNHTCYEILSSVQDLSLSFDLKVYPNPVSNELQIELPKPIYKPSIIQISDALGKIVFNEQKSNLEHNTYLNISELNKGLYYLSVRTDEEIFVSKFVKN